MRPLIKNDLGEGRRGLRYAAVLYAAGVALHTADHLRRGSDVLTLEARGLGGLFTVLAGVTIVLVLSERGLGPLAAVAIGFSHAIVIGSGHLLPRWNDFSDTFPGAAPGSGVTWMSWATALLEMAGALSIGVAGARALGRTGPRSLPRPVDLRSSRGEISSC